MVAATDGVRSRKKSSRGHHRFVGVRQRPSGRWVAEIKDSIQKDVSESGADANDLLGALKAKLFDRKEGKVSIPFPANCVQSGLVPRSTQNCSGRKELSSATSLSQMNVTANTMPALLSPSSNTSAKSVLIPNHDDHEGAVPMQMSQFPDNSLLASASATIFPWPLSGVIESTVDMTCTDQGPSNSNRSGQTNMVSMQLPLAGGATEGFWTLDQQQFVQCENNSWFNSSASWDPLLYVPSELA
ncbi:AP2/ERF domain superfamily [Sesbania bispinosa]|nr:AP2/ERF domain superfamily [Sesbania bispinosa]